MTDPKFKEVKKKFKALLEIFLITSGVLIAVQVNNHNEDIRNSKRISKELSSLKKELIENKAKFDERQTLRHERLKIVRKNLSELADGVLSDSTLRSLHKGAIYSGVTNPTTGVISSLINTGDLNLIKSDQLKYTLSEWLELLQNLKENEEILWDVNTVFMNYSEKNYPKGEDRLWANFDKLNFNSLRLKFSNDLYYRNILIRQETALLHSIEACQFVYDELNILLKLIEDEVN